MKPQIGKKNSLLPPTRWLQRFVGVSARCRSHPIMPLLFCFLRLWTCLEILWMSLEISFCMADQSSNFSPLLKVCLNHLKVCLLSRKCLTEAERLERHRGNLDSDQDKDNCIKLQWQKHAPIFSNDLDIYVQEKHKSLPVFQYAELQYLPGREEEETNLIILFRHGDSLESFQGFR